MPVMAVIAVGTAIANKASKDSAARSQKRGANRAAELTKKTQEENKADLLAANDYSNQVYQPLADAGNTAFKQQQDLAGVNGPDAQRLAFANYQQSPGVEFQRQQGMRGIEQNLAQTGTGGGTRLKAISQFNQGLAMQDFANQFARVKDVAQTGLGATDAMVKNRFNTTTANNAGATGAAENRGAYIQAASNADAQRALNTGEMVNSIGSAAMSMYSGGVKPSMNMPTYTGNQSVMAPNGAQSSPVKSFW